jgi:general secretion pathway protein F
MGDFMAAFSYRAVDQSGRLVEGTFHGADQAALIAHLRGQGLQPVQMTDLSRKDAGIFSGGLFSRAGRLGFSLDQAKAKKLTSGGLAMMSRELATLLDAGLPLEQGLQMLAQQDGGRTVAAKVAGGLLEKVRSGASFADALQDQSENFPGHFIGLVRAGEAGGTLDRVLLKLADSLERSHALAQDIRSALNYPILILVASGGAVLVLLLGVIPEFEPLFSSAGNALPMSARIVMGASRLLQQFWWALPLAIIIFYIIMRFISTDASLRARIQGQWLDLPLIGPLMRKIEAARFCGTLGTLIENGVDVVPALQMSGKTLSNARLVRAVEQVVPRLRRGEGLAEPLVEAGVLPPLAARLIRVGEQSGRLDVMLLTTARIYEGEIGRETRKLVSLLVPMVTLFLGILVAGIIGSILSAILTSYDLPF